MVGMPTKRTFYGSQGKVGDVDEDKDKEGLIHPSLVSRSPVHVHLETRGKNDFCQSLHLFPH